MTTKTLCRLAASAGALTLLLLAGGCSDASSELCRLHPERCDDGQAGSFCQRDRDCQGVCCTDKENCASGMCTFRCQDDRDCPQDMACEHDVCFYKCRDDHDCAAGMSCEHGNTVCEWD